MRDDLPMKNKSSACPAIRLINLFFVEQYVKLSNVLCVVIVAITRVIKVIIAMIMDDINVII